MLPYLNSHNNPVGKCYYLLSRDEGTEAKKNQVVYPRPDVDGGVGMKEEKQSYTKLPQLCRAGRGVFTGLFYFVSAFIVLVLGLNPVPDSLSI